jgi:two-component sensor histidine kinase
MKSILCRAALLLACLVTLGSCSSFEPGRGGRNGPKAVGGVLDLRAWDFAAQGGVDLEGEWDFASGELLDEPAAARFTAWRARRVPDFWKAPEGGDRYGTGAGTYRLRILLPAKTPLLAIRSYTGCNAFELEACGELVVSAGRPALSRQEAVSGYNPGVSPVEAKGGEIRILLRVSNWDYRYGGLWRSPSLGERRSLEARQRKAADISLVLFAALAALALNSLIIFLNRRREKGFLLFSFFGLVLALRPLVTGEYLLLRFFPSLPFNILVRLEYSTAFLCVPLGIAFFLDAFPLEHKRRWTRLLLPPFGLFVLCDLFVPLYWLTWIIFPFYALSIAAMAATAVVVGANLGHIRSQGGAAMLAGAVVIALCGTNDILYSSHLLPTTNLLPYALAAFMFFLDFVLARRFTSAFDRAEQLSRELGASNASLCSEVAKANAASARLEESLADKEMLLKEVHHRVKNSLQIVSSIVSLQANRSREPETIAMSAALKERIRAISLAHEQLYDLDSGDSIDLAAYAASLLDLILSSYDAEACPIKSSIEAEHVEADVGLCIDFGLVLTELATNAIRHGLLPKGGGALSVALRREGGFIILEVGDDGPGFPASFDPGRAKSLGYKMASSLIRRRSGSIAVSEGSCPAVSCSMRVEQAHPVG